MRITYIKLTGYIGIYNGLGLNELEIDLSPGKHKITVISGINGCGKSTLLNAMNILPDSSQDFIPDVPAEKRLRIEDGPNIYDICITSPTGKNGTRGTSKASIMKNGIELNPNGNISSYKDIVFDEFELDSNFIALCRLSSDDRGLADKSPAERKKFMNFIIDSLDTYNAIYKNLNKKSSVFKSYINNLHNKIQNIGDEDAIRASLNRFKSDSDAINGYINDLNTEIIGSSARIYNLDPNGELRREHEKAQNDLDEYKSKKKKSDLAYQTNMAKLKDPNGNLDVMIVDYSDKIGAFEKSFETITERKNQLISRSEALGSDIHNTSVRIYALSEEVDPSVKENLQKATETMKSEFDNMILYGVSNPDDITSEELELVFNTIATCINMVDKFYELNSEEVISLSQTYTAKDIETCRENIAKYSKLQKELEKEIESISKDIDIMSALDKKPEDCINYQCPFIKVAHDTLEKYSCENTKDVSDRLDKIQEELTYNTYQLNQANNYLEELGEAEKAKDELEKMQAFLTTNASILNKVSIGKDFIDKFIPYILSYSNFNEFRDTDAINNAIYTFNEYKRAQKTVDYYKTKLEKQSNSETLLEELNSNLNKLKEDQSKINDEANSCIESINDIKSLLSDMRKEHELIYNAICAKEVKDQTDKEFDKAQKTLDNILSKSKECIDLMNRRDECSRIMADQQKKLAPIKDRIGECEAQLMMLDSYKQEYAMYSKKYDIVDVLKKYSSPTTGIQTVFMDLYMSKTLELANTVLGMIFGGQYRLLDYVINANEFRMPFIGSGMVVDDISSGSTSQVCMMGMVMNLVLKYQASPKYNITSLDEIDGGLDTRNRLEFIEVLYKLIDILNIDQMFIISHSLEIELSNVNIIKLKSYDDFGDSPSMDDGCCVLYDFNKR